MGGAELPQQELEMAVTERSACGSWLRFDQFIQQTYFGWIQREEWRRVWFSPVQHGQPEYPPPDDAEDGDQVHESFRASQFGLLGVAP